MSTDHDVTRCIQSTAEHDRLLIDFRYHGSGGARTVYLTAAQPQDMQEANTRLRTAQARLTGAGIHAQLGVISNPYHPQYGEPVLEIDSVWWQP